MTSPAEGIDPDTAAGTVAGDGTARRPTLSLDVALYESYLADRDLGEAQKRELLEALWAIIVGFVDLGFAVEPAIALSEMPGGRSEELVSAGFARVDYCTSSTTDHFEKAATNDTSPEH